MAPHHKRVENPPNSCLTNLIHSGVLGGGVRVFGPYFSRFFSAWLAVKPCRDESNLSNKFSIETMWTSSSISFFWSRIRSLWRFSGGAMSVAIWQFWLAWRETILESIKNFAYLDITVIRLDDIHLDYIFWKLNRSTHLRTDSSHELRFSNFWTQMALSMIDPRKESARVNMSQLKTNF